jgi:hypothetical protein
MDSGTRIEPGNTAHCCKDEDVVDDNLSVRLLKSKKDFLECCTNSMKQSPS